MTQTSLQVFVGISERPALIDVILNCFKDGAAHALREVYERVMNVRPETKESTIRGRLNENNGKLFKRIARGVYIAIHGPGKLSYETCEIDPALLKEMYRVLKSEKEGTGLNGQRITGGAHMFLFVPALTGDTWVHVDALIKDAEQAGFEFNKLFIWDKVNIGMGYNGRNRYEALLFMSKGKRLIPFDFTIPDVLSVKRPDPAKRLHESEKPVELYEQLLRFSTVAGSVVLDIFAGSANIARAAFSLGRHCILFEKNTEFIEMLVQK